MKKLWNIIKHYKHVFIIGFFIIAIGSLMWMDRAYPVTYVPTIEREYEEVFDLNKVPAGMIIWRHGVPNTEMNFNHTDSSARYEFFDIGILTKDKLVYKVRVPFYTAGLFPLGGTVNLNSQKKSRKSIPKYRNFTIPKKNNKNI